MKEYTHKLNRLIQMSFETSLKTTDSGGNSYARFDVVPEN